MPYRITIDEVDMATADAFRAQVDQAVAAAAADGGVATLDFAEVAFFGSTGISILAQARQRLPDGGQLRAVNCSNIIRRVFSVSGLDAYVEVS
jgi:anti-anti-sigma factor